MDIQVPMVILGESSRKRYRAKSFAASLSPSQEADDKAKWHSNYRQIVSSAFSGLKDYPVEHIEYVDVLIQVIKQYTPLDNQQPQSGDVTIIAAHANGLMKELYEPLWDDLLVSARSVHLGIRGIWSADVAHQGESGILNESKIGNDPSWFDHSRDLLQMINHFRAFMQQPMFGVGHSMGACQLVHLSLMHPRLFESLVLIDPVIQRYTFGKGKKTPAHASAFRKDRWISRTTAADYCSRSDFYQSWDPRVLKRWIEYGFRELPTELYPEGREDSVGNVSIGTSSSAGLESGGSGDGRMQVQEQPVTLTTSRHQEVFTFARPIFPPSSLFNPTSRSSSSSSPVTSPSLLPSSSVSRSLSTSVASVATSISTSSPLSSSISNPPDLDPAADDPHSIFYRPEPIQTFHQLSHLRPTVLYIFGARSEISTPSMRAEKMAVTGVGVGGSRGPVMTSKSTSENAPLISHASNGTGKPLSPNSDGTNPKRSEEIREIVISEGNAGHLVPFEQVTRVANEIAAWIGAPKTRRRWMENTEKEKREWFGLSKEERRQLADGFLDRLRKDGGTMVGMRSKL